MNRFTKKAQLCSDLRTGKIMEYEQVENSNACVDKLGQLEDIEEELGIDLITLFKIIKQKYVYTNSFNRIFRIFIRWKSFYVNCIFFICFHYFLLYFFL